MEDGPEKTRNINLCNWWSFSCDYYTQDGGGGVPGSTTGMKCMGNRQSGSSLTNSFDHKILNRLQQVLSE